MVVFALLGAAAVALSQTEFRTHNTFMLMKVPCFLQYYHLGVLFREKLEKHFDKLNAVLVCLLSVAVNMLLISKFGRNISFPLYATMGGYELSSPFVPLITSITGIAFWLKVSRALVPVWGENRLVNFISENTFFLMTHHLAVKHIFLGILIGLHNAGIMDFSAINQQEFRMYAWYRYSDSFFWAVLCLIFTTVVCMVFCSAYLKLRKAITSASKA